MRNAMGLGEKGKIPTIVAVIVVGSGLILLWSTAPMPQSLSYHRFADAREIWGLPHCWNVLSNLPLLLAGIWGLWEMWRGKTGNSESAWVERGWKALFYATVLTASASAGYHGAPDNTGLFWDRLFLSGLLTGLPAVLLLEGGIRPGALMAGWVALGPLTVVFWGLSGFWGGEDIRPYAVVQTLAVLALPLILLLRRGRIQAPFWLWLAWAGYLAAKLAEWGDGPLYAFSGITGGHALKHLLAGLAAGLLVWRYRKHPWTTGAPRPALAPSPYRP